MAGMTSYPWWPLSADIGQGEAARELAEKLGVPFQDQRCGLSKTNGSSSGTAPQAECTPTVPKTMKSSSLSPSMHHRRREHFELEEPTKTWTYTAATVATMGYVYRFDPAERTKEFRPLNLHRKKGELEGAGNVAPLKCPLYGLHKLAERPFAKRCMWPRARSLADAAQKLLPTCNRDKSKRLQCRRQGRLVATSRARHRHLAGCRRSRREMQKRRDRLLAQSMEGGINQNTFTFQSCQRGMMYPTSSKGWYCRAIGRSR